MRLKKYRQTIEHQLFEFDTWITASLTEIKDTGQFERARKSTANILNIIGASTNWYQGEINSKVIAESIIDHVNSQTIEQGNELITSFLNFLFLVTGKSDNNCKCQFPVFLKERYAKEGFPKIGKTNGEIAIVSSGIPRVIKADTISNLVLGMKFSPLFQKTFLIKYIDFILSDDVYWRSLKAIGLGFARAESDGYGRDYLLPLVIFQIRGSLSASGGHEPENKLRILMREWGLVDHEDFNLKDHNVQDISAIEIQGSSDDLKPMPKDKVRAYDFVLPLNSKTIPQKVFIQCQFYAGDSGSVSHKNVDQTRATRNVTKLKVQDPFFVEFLDGAGYYGSLNGDLKKLLQMSDTYDFFQLRTASIKLRRVLQNIGFVTPLEIVHAVASTGGMYNDVLNLLQEQGYAEEEITAGIHRAKALKRISVRRKRIEINSSFREVSRRYFLLDSIAEKGVDFTDSKIITGAILIPGYSSLYGIKMNEIPKDIVPNAGIFKADWKDSVTLFDDIQFLADLRWIIQC